MGWCARTNFAVVDAGMSMLITSTYVSGYPNPGHPPAGVDLPIEHPEGITQSTVITSDQAEIVIQLGNRSKWKMTPLPNSDFAVGIAAPDTEWVVRSGV